MRTRRAVAGGCAPGVAVGWNVSNTGAVADRTAVAYDVSLATAGLFTTVLFVTHAVLQTACGPCGRPARCARPDAPAAAAVAAFWLLALLVLPRVHELDPAPVRMPS